MNLILIAVISLGAIALVLAAILYVASKKFAVYEDPRIAQVLSLIHILIEPAGNPVVQAFEYPSGNSQHPVLLRSRYLSSGSCGYGSVPRPFREDGHGGSLRRV